MGGVTLLGLQKPRQHTGRLDVIEGHCTFDLLPLRLTMSREVSEVPAMVAEELADASCDRRCMPAARGGGATFVLLLCLVCQDSGQHKRYSNVIGGHYTADFLALRLITRIQGPGGSAIVAEVSAATSGCFW